MTLEEKAARYRLIKAAQKKLEKEKAAQLTKRQRDMENRKLIQD